MKVKIIEAPSNPDKPAIRIIAESEEDHTVLWCLSKLGPARYDLIANDDAGDARVSSLVLEDKDAG